MNSQTITKSNLKKIYDIACSGWKTKIENYAKRNPFDDEISLTENEIDEMFEAADTDQTKILKKFFVRENGIMDRVTSFLTACKELNLNPDSVYHDNDLPDEVAFKKLKVIIKALNQGWKPNWSNSSENKFWNYFYYATGVFSFHPAIYSITHGNVPSALHFKNRELAEHCAKIAFKEYKEFYS